MNTFKCILKRSSFRLPNFHYWIGLLFHKYFHLNSLLSCWCLSFAMLVFFQFLEWKIIPDALNNAYNYHCIALHLQFWPEIIEWLLGPKYFQIIPFLSLLL